MTATVRTTAPPYPVFGLILFCFAVVRFIDLFTSQAPWRIWIQESATSGDPARFVFGTTTLCAMVLLALVTSCGAALYLKSHLPKWMTVLVCMFVGGVATLLISSAVGMLIGALVGTAAIYSDDKETLGFLNGVRRVILPTCLMGLLTGALCQIAATIIQEDWLLYCIVPGLLLAGVGACIVVLRWTHTGKRSWFHWPLCAIVFLGWLLGGFGTTFYFFEKWGTAIRIQ